MSRDIGPAPVLGDVERGILLAAEREARPARYWTGGQDVGNSDVQVVAVATLREILHRSSVLRGPGGEPS